MITTVIITMATTAVINDTMMMITSEVIRGGVETVATKPIKINIHFHLQLLKHILSILVDIKLSNKYFHM